MDAPGEQEVEFYSIENFKSNVNLVNFCHTFMAIVAGCLAGIIGFTGFTGFLFFLVLFLSTSLILLLAKMNFFQIKEYLINTTWYSFLFDSIAQHASSYVLFWTLSYALVHIY